MSKGSSKKALGKEMGRGTLRGRKRSRRSCVLISDVRRQNWAQNCEGHQVAVEHEDDITGPG